MVLSINGLKAWKGTACLTSTSASPGSLLKHMVMVFRAILKKLVRDIDFPCKEQKKPDGNIRPEDKEQSVLQVPQTGGTEREGSSR